ncbi:hypothetical protein [Helicobacter pametensis]|uniref:hypothetical protein n=1 Tax=Helicobacter pametensis TaxID=95149 RepID=UPI0004B0296C|nr:hypothetical protein [Helicobacter pametensis]
MIDRLKEGLQKCQYKSDLEVLLKSLLSYEIGDFERAYVQSPQDYLQVAQTLRERLLTLVLKNGDVGESFYLATYLVFAPIEGVDSSNELEVFIKTAQEYFLQEGLSDIENLMLLELEVLGWILSGESKKGIQRYIQGISHLQMHLGPMGRASEFIREAFPKMGISMELFLESMREILALEYCMSLPIMRARSILNWQLHCFWNITSFFNHRSWLELYPLWRELFYAYLKSPQSEHLDHAMYMQFFIYHMCGNSYASQDQWRSFCDEIDLVASRRYEEFGREHHLACVSESTPKPKRVIGILRDRIVENSPYKVEYSFLKQILAHPKFSQVYTIKIYLMSLLEKSDNSEAAMQNYRGLGIEIFDVGAECNQEGFYNSHLHKALRLNEEMKKDGVDILISPNNGYGISDFLLAVRSAKKQIFWSHGNFVYNLPYLDSKMTHICGNATSLRHEGYEFVGVPVVMDREFYDPYVPQEIINHHRAKYPKDKQIIGTIGRLTKIDSLPYLRMIVSLMQEFPDTIYLACGSGNIKEIQSKLEEILGEGYEEFMKRFYFCGYVDSAIYGHILDLWLDSFPMEQGESRIEYVAKGKLSLVLAKDPSKIKQEWKTMAVDEEDYREKARYLLGLGSGQKQALIDEIMGGLARYNQNREEMGVESFLECLNGQDSYSHRL